MSTCALVVGGTSGIGYAMACRIAPKMAQSRVLICGRTRPTDIPYQNIEFHRLEATSMHEIKRFADEFKLPLKIHERLDYLVMTQGIMSTAGRMETVEGIDRKMALHFYGKQLLIRELLDSLGDTGQIIIVYDGRSGNPKTVRWDDLDLKEHFSLGNAANHCMVMNDCMIQYFAAQQRQDVGTKRQLQFVHAWPGGVDTGLLRDFPVYLQSSLRFFGKYFIVSPAACAEYLLGGAAEMAAAARSDGKYWSNIDNKGNDIKNKTIFSQEVLNQVARHTWKLIDSALEERTK